MWRTVNLCTNMTCSGNCVSSLTFLNEHIRWNTKWNIQHFHVDNNTSEKRKERRKGSKHKKIYGSEIVYIQIELTEHAQTLTLILHGLGFPTLYNVHQQQSLCQFAFFVFRVSFIADATHSFFAAKTTTFHHHRSFRSKESNGTNIFDIDEAKKFQFIYFFFFE